MSGPRRRHLSFLGNYPSPLPYVEWIWTAPPPEGKRVQIWVDAAGHPLEVDIDVSDLTPLSSVPEATAASPPPTVTPGALPPELEFDFRPIPVVVSRVTTPTLDETALAALLVQCGE